MAHRNKRSKPNDYHERHNACGFAEHGESSQGGSRGLTEHSGQGVLNRDGNFHTGGNFDASHYHHNSHVLIQPTFINESPNNPEPKSTKEEKRRELLESLNFAQIDVRRTSIKIAHRNTCKWLLKTPQYREWLDTAEFDKHGGFLWIKGKPGAGKSTLMKSAFSHAHRCFKKKGVIVVSFFFNARGEELEKSTVGLYRSLLLQLLEEHPHLQRVLDSIRPGHQWNIESLKSLIEEVVCAMEEASIVCFIDALDECEEQEVRDMLSFLQTISEQAASIRTKLRVCFASRHYPHITIQKGLDLVIEGREEHEKDIADYLGTELRIGHDRLAEQIRSELKEKALGVFMWVVLVVDILNKEYDRGRKYRLRQRLKDIPGDLHELFRDILTRDHNNTRGLLLCIQWVLFARRPLTSEELYFAIMSGMEPDNLFNCHSEQEITREDMQKYILDNSKGLAESTKSKAPTIQFIHESVRDFLLKENGLQKIWPELESNIHGESHEKLKQCCLAYLNDKIVQNFQLPKPLPEASTPEAAALRLDAAKSLPFLQYAYRGILHHASKAESNGVSQKEFLTSFSLTKWIEYNNLFERLPIRRCTSKASLLYILAERDFANLIRTLDSRQSCFDVEEERYGTPIFAALATRSNDAAQALLEAQVKTQPPDSHLHGLCERFAKGGRNINNFTRHFEFSSRRNIAYHLIEEGDSLILEILLSTEKNRSLQSMDILLRLAVSLRNEDAIRVLLVRGVDISDENIIKTLLNHSADTNGCYPSVHILLYSAAFAGREDSVKLFLECGGDVNGDVNGDGTQNSLYWAVSGEQQAIVSLLLDYGANVNGNGTSAGSHVPLVEAVRRRWYPGVELLINHGARTQSRDINGRTPLLQAAYNGSVDILRLLLAKGADTKAKDMDSVGVLSLARRKEDNDAVIQLLLEHGVVDD
ncbi:hypothetical protein F4776DRAFT_42914 [Hypoxylon sp. NC0597]|nr:hypothetical protein F4776DRAFT_42914 [Hypoxylon sp. NC0597]